MAQASVYPPGRRPARAPTAPGAARRTTKCARACGIPRAVLLSGAHALSWCSGTGPPPLSPFQIDPRMHATASGLQYVDISEGTGPVAAPGQDVTVHYTGWLYNQGVQGAKFDSSKDRNDPLCSAWAQAW